ncbi:copper resistance protein CopC [Arthrobacter zhangbolii]|uniref:Copper resistance protein CopC n=1 Tax=Arthrobacter zhangbolii TaxID=2886936 RepID=A0A9X1S8H9_9MICC|nr:copper resistance CopC family protein [Arthrobacter zhangbolii]MCC3272575.1 copper resistance protein CopC [Arthrobacter zhangbolii]UON91575.1 copper resistance protein CopC [Arthrobacter zhangbolii]
MPSINLSPPFPMPFSAAVPARPRRSGPYRAVLAAVLAMGLAVGCLIAALASAAPAAAHDQLVGTAPAAGERLDAAPEQLELTFSSVLMDVGHQVLVLDADGRDWAGADPRLNRETLVQPLPEELPRGEYSVRWRVVSSDGHPIAGRFEFLVGADAVAGSAVDAVPGTDAAGSDNAAGMPAKGSAETPANGTGAAGDTQADALETDAVETDAAEPDTAEAAAHAGAEANEGLPDWVLPGICGAAAGLLIYAGYAVFSRRRQRSSSD